MESITHLTTNAQIVAHLQAVAHNLQPGGLLVIESAHPATLWRDNLPNAWTARDGATEIEALFGLADDPYDAVTQVWTVTSRLSIREPGLPERIVETRYPHRWCLAQELRALIDLSGAWDASWWYGNLAIPPHPLDDSDDSERMVVVLRRSQLQSPAWH